MNGIVSKAHTHQNLAFQKRRVIMLTPAQPTRHFFLLLLSLFLPSHPSFPAKIVHTHKHTVATLPRAELEGVKLRKNGGSGVRKEKGGDKGGYGKSSNIASKVHKKKKKKKAIRTDPIPFSFIHPSSQPPIPPSVPSFEVQEATLKIVGCFPSPFRSPLSPSLFRDLVFFKRP